MGHLYKGDLLYREIRSGNLYPLFDRLWYNGVEMMRYWAPLPVYAIALCIGLGGGSVTEGYLWFLFLICLFGALVWLRLGFYYRRPLFGCFLGLLWFFMPNNLYAMYGEGNLPRSLCMVFLPLFVHYVHSYLDQDRVRSLPKLILVFSLMALCHMGYAGMIALSVLIWLLFEGLLNHRMRKCFHVFVCMLLGFLWTGLWAYASLQGGITSTDSSQVMQGFFQPLLLSVNPFYRLTPGGITSFYFGLAAFLVALFGLFFSHRREMTGFAASLVILICTTSSMYPILVLLPGSQYLWMLRFISIALCLILFHLLLWNTLKKGFLAVCCVLLVLDCIPSLQLILNDQSGLPVEQRLQETSDETLITYAKTITIQRIALIDESTLGSMAPFLISDHGEAKATSFGAGFQSAVTAPNIVRLNEAVDLECYPYLFDRCLELGNDTVLIKTAVLKANADGLERLDQAAESVGYQLMRDNGGYRVYHIQTPEQFGVKTKYDSIGIGKAAGALALYFPNMEEGSSDSLDDYSFDELSAYKLIYLDGFQYSDRERAEQLVKNLSERGIRIIIEASGIPIDLHTGIRSFLGVTTSWIRFKNGYPDLYTTEGRINPEYFAPGYSDWSTVYLNGLTNVWGHIEEQGEELSFLGSAYNDNIIFIGLGLSYHYSLTADQAVGRLLEKTLAFPAGKLPERKLIPLAISYEGEVIRIRSGENDVNTTLSWHDMFDFSTSNAYEKNHLLYVGGGETVVRMHYPYLPEGLFTTLVAAFFTLVFFIALYYLRNSKVLTRIEILGITPPATGERISFTARVPEDAAYSIADVIWEKEGHRARPGESFAEGSYLLRVKLKALGRNRFGSETKVLVGLKDAEVFYNRDENKQLRAEVLYEAFIPLRFVTQPEDLRGKCGNTVEAKWRMNRPPRAGCLQVFRQDDWQTTEVFKEQNNMEFSHLFRSAKPMKERYRIAYLNDTGEMIVSDAFYVVFT